uniref:Peptidase C39-like domain-containing protein n=1 Tax=Arion vulgaris TaxID=1028688 RepID=A0A0B7AM51_9EUPU
MWRKVFYQKHFSVDEIRVKEMFNKAAQQGILVQKRSLSIEDMIVHLQEDNPIISLVNWTLMTCLWCESKVRKCWSCITCNQGPYQGHFVVVVGFDRQKDLIFYKNPDGRSHDLCGIQSDQFQKARISDGTDQDTLFVFNQTFKGGISNCGGDMQDVGNCGGNMQDVCN